jgi:CheY-like chemotaxis protein
MTSDGYPQGKHRCAAGPTLARVVVHSRDISAAHSLPDAIVPPDVEPPPVILVVDDEAAVNRVVTRYLTHVGYRVLEACSAEEALELVRRQDPRIDLVLADVVMPGAGGIDLAATLLSRAPGPSVILMTGVLPEEVERLDVNGQVVRVLRKPLDLDEVQQVLRVTLEGYPSEGESDTVHRAG